MSRPRRLTPEQHTDALGEILSFGLDGAERMEVLGRFRAAEADARREAVAEAAMLVEFDRDSTYWDKHCGKMIDPRPKLAAAIRKLAEP